MCSPVLDVGVQTCLHLYIYLHHVLLYTPVIHYLSMFSSVSCIAEHICLDLPCTMSGFTRLSVSALYLVWMYTSACIYLAPCLALHACLYQSCIMYGCTHLPVSALHHVWLYTPVCISPVSCMDVHICLYLPCTMCDF
jgi:hypothetical protein